MSRPVVVIKVGSQALVDQPNAFAQIAQQFVTLQQAGMQCILVSSGAVALGRQVLGRRVNSLSSKELSSRLLAGIGQVELMQLWQSALPLPTAQVLIGYEHVAKRPSFLRTAQQLSGLLAGGIVPVVNENDLLAADNYRFNNNDALAAIVAQMMSAQWLFLLTDVGGLFQDYPANQRVVERVTHCDEMIQQFIADTRSKAGTGGMSEKIAAAQSASKAGIHSVISAVDSDLLAIIDGRVNQGTRVVANQSAQSTRRQWLADISAASGYLVIDQGAAEALLHRSASLLLPGVVEIGGNFNAREVIAVKQLETQKVIAKGFSRHSSTAIALAMEQSKHSELSVIMHRNDLVVLA
ncbi:MAG: glutamate 5-kinase [Gammaproteobacteria bacterium]|nr:glutamate 5-kinase [Gammaproteobacteria bacterium]